MAIAKPQVWRARGLRISWRRAWAEVARLPKLPVLILLVFTLAAALGDLVTPVEHTRYDLINALKPPAWIEGSASGRVLGTDEQGRDILSRVIAGARISMVVAVVGILLSAAVGTAIGMVSGYLGGWADIVIMRFTDIWLSIPGILLALLFVILLEASVRTVIMVIAILGWTSYARVVRGQVLSLKTRDYVALAKVAGASPFRILTVHLLPQVVNTLLVLMSLSVGTIMILEASLSFLGLGVQPPQSSWGLMLSSGRNYLTTAWWLSVWPGLAILLVALSANLFGDWLRDRLDPKLRQV